MAGSMPWPWVGREGCSRQNDVGTSGTNKPYGISSWKCPGDTLYRRPRTTKAEPGHKIYPYLLRGVEIARPNQVWAMDISVLQQAA